MNFRSQFDPIQGYKTVKKKKKKKKTATCEHRESSRVTFRIRLKTADAQPIDITDNQVSAYSNTIQRPLMAYQPTSHHHAVSKHTSYPRTTYTYSPPDPSLVEEESQSRTTYTHSLPNPYLLEEESLYLL